MKIYIELLLILVLIFMYMIWKLWLKFSTKKLLKKYKPEDDKARKGGTIIGGVEKTESADGIPNASNVGLDESEGRELLPETNADDVRKNSSGFRKFLRRSKSRS